MGEYQAVGGGGGGKRHRHIRWLHVVYIVCI